MHYGLLLIIIIPFLGYLAFMLAIGLHFCKRNESLSGWLRESSGVGLTVLAWKHLGGGIFELYEIVPGFAVSALCIVLFSLAGKPSGKTALDQFGSVP